MHVGHFYLWDAMARLPITISITMAWWWKLYLYPTAWMCAITRQQPDMAKVEYWIKKAMRVRVQ